MASVIVSLKIMPASPEINLSHVESEARKKIVDFAGEGEMKVEQEPIAFGLKLPTGADCAAKSSHGKPSFTSDSACRVLMVKAPALRTLA